jgi:hypothetical protein
VVAAMASAGNEPTDVAGIMARVAANQEAAREARQNYVYRQEQTIRMRRPNGKLAREQMAEYVVTPGKVGVEKQLAKFAGKYESKGKYISYDQERYEYKDLDIDGDLIGDIAQDMMNDGASRDGIGQDLFPLIAKEQTKYAFRLVRKEEYRGRTVYRVAFEPRRGEEQASWKGEALIDAQEYQPVSISTSLAQKIPAAVKVLLGTDIKGLGFSIAYRKFADGVWFPVSYGGEFTVRGLFFYRRNISVALSNGDFRKTDVKSTLVYAADAH